MKKTYLKPEIELLTFYSSDEILNTEDESISGDMQTVALNELGFDWS